MKVCDMCGKEIEDDDSEIDESVTINLGGDEATYLLCGDCAKRVEDFIKSYKKEA